MKVTITIECDNKGKVVPTKGVEELNPKELLLYSAAYCAALTLKGILDKEQISPKRLEIEMSGTLNTQTVTAKSIYTDFNILYRIECSAITEQAKIGRAVRLTTEKYCGMLQMISRIATLTQEVAIVSTE
ncbi:MAG: OsmC family protein [Alistipes sp.]|nr:OsmC family protein [Alistipes sp.]